MTIFLHLLSKYILDTRHKILDTVVILMYLNNVADYNSNDTLDKLVYRKRNIAQIRF